MDKQQSTNKKPITVQSPERSKSSPVRQLLLGYEKPQMHCTLPLPPIDLLGKSHTLLIFSPPPFEPSWFRHCRGWQQNSLLLIFNELIEFLFYFRLEPTRPITIHQKALFLFWLSIIFLCVTLKSKRYILKWRDKWKAKQKKEEEADLAEKGINLYTYLHFYECKDCFTLAYFVLHF